ncbi:hypothetical protein EW146_g1746 [Bondarzewia mesenterica]|uniref:NADP-dependent oxidoreductase domain-containing protein n=1 Tax=Bondarzewia mesenterica TaxID=1095465 RepID=A0A4S4M2X7_9AGAM|nr:hypothetical protein EW146_g1746 [Bondarzewia mesenterica]
MVKLPTRKIGNTEVSAIGYGAMGISAFYGSAEPDEARLKFLDGCYERGCTNWDTADCYDDSEDLIGKWFKRSGKRDEIFLATKVGFVFGDKMIDGSPEYIKSAVEKSLKRLGTNYIDLLHLHRAGKVKYLGLSEASASTLRRAHAVHPISALEIEYSPFTLDIEDPKIGLLKTARELGVAVIAYSPLGRGLLTGRFKGPEDFPEGDSRPSMPRFSKENFPNVLKLVDDLEKIGKKHGATAGQVTLAWVLAQGDDIIPIPGTRKLERLDENLGALNLKLSTEELDAVRKAADKSNIASVARYASGWDLTLFVDTPPL